MKQIPAIAVSLIHIQGPLKGEIQEFLEPTISIGRHPSCNVVFPAETTIISRRHATITREGNRFKLVDKSANGTYVNGKRVQEAYLKDGDVLIFAEGGPKVSFLTQAVQGNVMPPPAKTPAPTLPSERPAADLTPHPQVEPPHMASSAAIPNAIVETVRVPVVIQYGPTLRDFKQVPITIGKSPACDFTMDHPGMAHEHAQIFFSQEQYWIKDLTGKQSILVNNQPISSPVPLNPKDRLTLFPGGPEFRFLGQGRLAEIVDSSPREPSNAVTAGENIAVEKPNLEKPDKKSGSFFKKILNR